LPESLAVADEWLAEPIWILVEIGERDSFGAEVSTAEWICVISADADHAPIVDLHGHAAAGFAERARAVVRPSHATLSHHALR
jgi:hypothetical protein